jgi:hypothetical protein
MQSEKKHAAKSTGNGENLGVETTQWLAADKMPNNVDAAKHAARWNRSRVTQPPSRQEPALHV